MDSKVFGFYQNVELRLPLENEIAYLIKLRNRFRHWFCDQRFIDFENGSIWLKNRDEYDCLCCITSNHAIVGTIGWVRIHELGDKYEIGRLIVDYQSTELLESDHTQIWKAFKIGGCLALDHLFLSQSASCVFARIHSRNNLARNMVQEYGFIPCAWPLPDEGKNLESWQLSVGSWTLRRDIVLDTFVNSPR